MPEPVRGKLKPSFLVQGADGLLRLTAAFFGQHAVNIAAALFRRLGRGWRSSGSPLVRDDLF
jgi:hypothetical protein